MFRCEFVSATSTTWVDGLLVLDESYATGIYIEAIVDNGQKLAVILHKEKLITVPFDKVKWTGWTD